MPAVSPDLTITNSAGPSGAVWPSDQSAFLKTNDGFAIPKRPSEQRHHSVVGAKRKAPVDHNSATHQLDSSKRSTMSDTSEGGQTPTSRPAYSSRSQSGTTPFPNPLHQHGSTNDPQPGPSQAGPSVRLVLPPRKVFPIQVGDKLFRLSGASLS